MHPILFQVPTPWGTLPVYSYGVMLGLSLLAAWYIIMYLGTTKERLDRELMANCFIVTAVTGIVGARLLYVLTNLGSFETAGEWFELRSGGLVAYGGFLGGLLGSLSYLKWRGVPLLAWADLVAPTLALGTSVTRIGCYLYGCDFGMRLGDSAPGWLKTLGTFPHWAFDSDATMVCASDVHGSPAYIHHVRTQDLPIDATTSFPVHPTQLYESLACLLMFGATIYVWRHRSFRGQVIFVLTLLYSVFRFFIEMVRDDPERGGAFDLSTSQLIALALVPVAVVGYVVTRKRSLELGEPPIPKSAQLVPEAATEAKDKAKDKPKEPEKKAGKKRRKAG